MRGPFVFVLTALPGLALAESHAGSGDSWTCRNSEAEISCTGAGCKVTAGEGFTPMEVSVGTDAAMQICAYSGCWAGQAGTMTTTGGLRGWTATDLRWSDDADNADVAGTVTIDTGTGVGFVMIEEFAHPLTCG